MIYSKYVHHNKEVSVQEDLKGKHRDYCLCYSCDQFKPGMVDNCLAAQSLYEALLAKDNPIVVCPVWECTWFNELKTE